MALRRSSFRVEWVHPARSHPLPDSYAIPIWLIRAALGNVYAVLVLALLILVLGLISVASIPVDILPSFNTPAVQVMTFYSGMPGVSVEKTITNRIERWINQAPGTRLIE